MRRTGRILSDSKLSFEDRKGRILVLGNSGCWRWFDWDRVFLWRAQPASIPEHEKMNNWIGILVLLLTEHCSCREKFED